MVDAVTLTPRDWQEADADRLELWLAPYVRASLTLHAFCQQALSCLNSGAVGSTSPSNGIVGYIVERQDGIAGVAFGRPRKYMHRGQALSGIMALVTADAGEIAQILTHYLTDKAEGQVVVSTVRQGSDDTVADGSACFWIVDTPGYLSAGLRGRGWGATAAWAVGMMKSLPLDFTMRLGGRRPFAILDHVAPIPIDRLDKPFDEFLKIRQDHPGSELGAHRGAQSLRDYLNLVVTPERARVLVYDDGAIRGYAGVMQDVAEGSGLRRLVVFDVYADDNDPVVVSALLAGAYELAIARKCHALEIPHIPASLRDAVKRHKPYLGKSRASGLSVEVMGVSDQGTLFDSAPVII